MSKLTRLRVAVLLAPLQKQGSSKTVSTTLTFEDLVRAKRLCTAALVPPYIVRKFVSVGPAPLLNRLRVCSLKAAGRAEIVRKGEGWLLRNRQRQFVERDRACAACLRALSRKLDIDSTALSMRHLQFDTLSISSSWIRQKR